MHGAVDAAGEMHAEKRERRIGHRVDEPADQVGGPRREFVVLAPERQDPHRWRCARRSRDPVAEQAGAVDEHPGADRAPRRRLDGYCPAIVMDRRDATPEPDLRAVCAGQVGVPLRDGREVGDAGDRHQQRGDRT